MNENQERERRASYIDIGAKIDALVKEQAAAVKEQAVTNTNLENMIAMFNTHLNDDKDTVKRVDALSVAMGRVYGFAIASSFFGGALVKIFFR